MTRRASRLKSDSGRQIRPYVLGAVGAVAILGAGGLWSYYSAGPPARRGPSTEVVLPQGAGVTKIARALKRAGVIRSPLVFVVAAEFAGVAQRLKAGDYVVRSRLSMFSVLKMIRNGDVARRFITVPEGLSSTAVADILARDAGLSGSVAAPAEGSILPETYEIRRGEARGAVIRRMQAAQQDLLKKLWPNRAPDLPYRSIDAAVTMASIVEKETAKANERPHIAAVFINRLRAGMRLETDPTVIYGLTGGKPLGHGLRVSELAKRTAYNTYQVNGLPPTAIANPGKAALVAALHPAKSPDLYFVADGAGGHVFAATFADHQRHVAQWRAIELARLRLGPRR